MTPARPVFILSDHTGITAEIIGKSLLSQFPGEAFATESLPFVDTPDKAQVAVERILSAWKVTSLKPLVFSTLTDPAARALIEATGTVVMDVYGHFLGKMIGELGRPAVPVKGQSHSASDAGAYHERIDAVNFSLAADDGLATQKYDQAALILVGVSRCGKTPTSLYMAMQYGLKVANYPLTPENFEHEHLPDLLLAYRPKLRGLTLKPERLAEIRAERRPNSHYAALATCKQEIDQAQRMMQHADIPVLDSSTRSIEEIAALLRQSLLKG
jgi:[pyruvate, water dikinase]-phosphate phosphotransferase / [pyruvate, water dikinase] kinase